MSIIENTQKESFAFKDRLKQVIGEQSIRSFAKKATLSDGTLRNLLSGGQPRLDNLLLIAEVGNVSVEWLATGKGNKTIGIHGEHSTKDERAEDYISRPLMEMAKETASKRSPEDTEKLLKAQAISLIDMSDGSPDSMHSAIVTLSMLLEHTFNLTSEGSELLKNTATAINAKNKK